VAWILQMLAFKTFEPEQNVFEKFDDGFTPKLNLDYDLANEADWKQINIASTKGDVKEGIEDPYEDQSPRVKVPDAVYTQDAPYKQNVVEIGEPTLGKPFHEYTHAEEGDAVMGKDYVDTPFKVTLDSVPEKNPSRDWEFLDVDAMAGKVSPKSTPMRASAACTRGTLGMARKNSIGKALIRKCNPRLNPRAHSTPL
jgi:hypothetical protein